MNKKYLIIGIIIIIVIAIGFYIIGFSSGKKASQSEALQYKEVIDDRLMIPGEIFIISGKIIDIQNNILRVETTIQDPYKVPEKWEERIMKISIDNETKITKPIPNLDPERSPDTKEFEEINFSELNIDDMVNVTAKENIKEKIEFTASFINVSSTAK